MNLAYTLLQKGEGLPLLFFHGFLGTGSDWRGVCAHLPNRTCIGVDLPGHGASLFQETFEIDLPRFHLIGYSMGGRIALQYAKKHPEQIASLTLLSTHPGLSTQEEKEARWESDHRWAHLLRELPIDEFLRQWYDQPLFKHFKPDLELRMRQNREELSRALLHFSLAKQPRFEIDEVYCDHSKNVNLSRRRLEFEPGAAGAEAAKLKKFSDASGLKFNGCPTLADSHFLSGRSIIVGEKDEKFRALYENPILIEGAGHMVHLENPKRVAEEIMKKGEL